MKKIFKQSGAKTYAGKKYKIAGPWNIRPTYSLLLVITIFLNAISRCRFVKLT
jgi:hypothetical protein